MALNARDFQDFSSKFGNSDKKSVTSPYFVDLPDYDAIAKPADNSGFDTELTVEKMRHWFRDIREVTNTPNNGNSQHYVNEKLGLQVVTEYYNYSNRAVWVTDSTGFFTKIHPVGHVHGPLNNTLCIKRTYSFNQLSLAEMTNELYRYLKLSEAKAPVLEHISEQLKKVNTFGNRAEVSMAFVFDITKLSENCIYFKEMDIAISTDSPVLHPGDNKFSHKRKIMSLASKKTGVGNFVEVVDNDGRHPNYYVFAIGKTHKVEPSIDRTRESGVYISKTVYVNGEEKIVTEVLTFDKAISEGYLFNTESEAVSGGDPARIIKKELAEAGERLERMRVERDNAKAIADAANFDRQRELAALSATYEKETMALKMRHEESKVNNDSAKMQNESIKVQQDMELANLKAELARKEHELKIKTMTRNDYYEDRSYARKDSSEFIKYALPIVAAITGYVIASRR